MAKAAYGIGGGRENSFKREENVFFPEAIRMNRY